MDVVEVKVEMKRSKAVGPLYLSEVMKGQVSWKRNFGEGEPMTCLHMLQVRRRTGEYPSRRYGNDVMGRGAYVGTTKDGKNVYENDFLPNGEFKYFN